MVEQLYPYTQKDSLVNKKKQDQSQETLTITGPLPGGRWLTRPLIVDIKRDDEEVIVSEPRFHLHGVGATVPEATEELRRILSEELDELTTDEEELGPRLQAELHYLRDLIRTA